jgi:hypothetical protein
MAGSEFPSNSNKQKPEPVAKPEPKKVERVTTGTAIIRKKPLGKKFKDVFIGENAKNAVVYVWFEVLIPQARDLFADALREGIDRRIYGDNRPMNRSSSRSRHSSSNGFVSYNRYSGHNSNRNDRDRRDDQPRNMSQRSRAAHNFDEIVLPTRVEAEEVVDRLFDLVSKYESATVADLYDLVGVSGNFTDEKYGWVDIRGAGVSRVSNGYLLDLPKPELLD